MNKIIVTGRVGKVHEIKQGANSAYIDFSIADNQGKDKTNWFYARAFGKTAERVLGVEPGDVVIVSGYLSSYTGKDGVTRWTVNVDTYESPLKGGRKKEAEDEGPDPFAD